jgi:hypothetical protein
LEKTALSKLLLVIRYVLGSYCSLLSLYCIKIQFLSWRKPEV